MSERTYGAPISKEMVRALRERAGLSQELLAARLGLAGKAVVSGWETGRTTCEGPAAELLLHLFAADGTKSFIALNGSAEAMWRRTGTWQDAWRQIAAIPEAPAIIERDAFAKLFPGTEIASAQRACGFPFVEVPEPNAYGIGVNGWSGSLPAEPDRAPRYLWQLDRTSAFVYREMPWEEGYDSITQGHTHVASLLELAVCGVVFLGRLAAVTKLDREWRYTLRLDLEGMRSRGVVTGEVRPIVAPKLRTHEMHLSAAHTCSIADAIERPRQTAYALVGELLVQVAPELASTSALERELATRLAADRRGGRRMLGMLDDLPGDE